MHRPHSSAPDLRLHAASAALRIMCCHLSCPLHHVLPSQLPSASCVAISAALRTMCCHLSCPPHHVLPSQLPSAPSAAISAALRTMCCHLSCPPHHVLPSQLPSAPCVAISAALRTMCCNLSCASLPAFQPLSRRRASLLSAIVPRWLCRCSGLVKPVLNWANVCFANYFGVFVKPEKSTANIVGS